MISSRIIPCLDLRDGKVVKGIRFQNLREVGDPVSCAVRYQEQGADEIVLLDVSATNEGRAMHVHTIEAIRREVGIPLTTGGGIRSIDDARRALDAGADKVGINTAAVQNPGMIDTLAREFGTQCIVLSLDVQLLKSAWKVVINAGTKSCDLDALDWALQAQSRGAGELLVTSWDRDGTGLGYDCALLQALRDTVSLPIIASGGASTPAHFVEALSSGANAVLAASMFHDGIYSIQEVKLYLSEQGVRVRL